MGVATIPLMTAAAETGVLLVQVGTPDAPTTKAVRRYLCQFLSDRRVVDVNPWIWKPILHGIILRTRPRRSAALYRRIWTEAGSPLLVHTEAQAQGVAERLGGDFHVSFGMLVGTPTVASRLDQLLATGVKRIVVLPLFPQFCTATTGSVLDQLERWERRHPTAPKPHLIRSFCAHPAYIEALRLAVLEAGVTPSAGAPLLMSFHGIPQRYADRGDPYPSECESTARVLATALELADDAWRLAYQSRFGRRAWLQPYADGAVAALPGEGIRSVTVTTPSFVADCLETIDEVGRELRGSFEEAGGEHFVRVPCVNASDAACDAFAAVVRDAL